MATPTRERQLIDGVWQYVTDQQSGGGGLPAGGSTGEVLTKESDADGDAGWEPGGGGFTPEPLAAFSGDNGVSIANGASAPVKWELPTGTALLDISTATAPKVLVTGIYAVTAQPYHAGISVNGWYEVDVILGDNGMASFSPIATVAQPNPFIAPLTFVVYITTAQSTLTITVANNDGANAVVFYLAATVQRIA